MRCAVFLRFAVRTVAERLVAGTSAAAESYAGVFLRLVRYERFAVRADDGEIAFDNSGAAGQDFDFEPVGFGIFHRIAVFRG